MKITVALLVIAAAGLIGGAWLIGRWAVGLAVIVDSAGVALYALVRDDGRPVPQGPNVEILERYRNSA
jgi:hypothetical protein